MGTEDVYGMSDDDFLNANPDDLNGSQDTPDEGQDEEELPNEPIDTEEEETLDEESEDDGELEEDSELDADESDEESEELDSEEEEETNEGEEEEVKGPLYQFKAAGREVEINSQEEAEKLMKMGVDYHEKMRGMKPYRKTLKTLETNKITDDDINLLIDLKNGNKDAISKLVKDHEIDVHDLDTDEESNYTPSNHTATDAEVELDEAIASIQATDSFSDTMKVVNGTWDEASKRTIVANPSLLTNLNNHVADGRYEAVMKEVTRQRILGDIGSNLSDIQAYEQVGMQMAKAGKFNASNKAQPTEEISIAPKAKATDKARKDKMRKASPPKRSTQKATPKAKYNPLELSDEEFMKQFN